MVANSRSRKTAITDNKEGRQPKYVGRVNDGCPKLPSTLSQTACIFALIAKKFPNKTLANKNNVRQNVVSSFILSCRGEQGMAAQGGRSSLTSQEERKGRSMVA